METTNSFDEIRLQLIERARKLTSRRGRVLAREQELLDSREPDWEDLAADRTAASLLERLSEDELAQLERIQESLRRLELGTYGLCVACGKSIAEARLKAVPEAARCAGCSNGH